jgi:hypothetical protein
MKSIKRATPTSVSAEMQQRDEKLLLGRRMDAASELLLRKPTLIEELRKQRFVGLRDEFDQLAVDLGDALFPVAVCRFLGEPASASSYVCDNVVAEHV